jgi:hypothetical protein
MYATEKRGNIVDTGHFDICTDSTVATVKHVTEKTNTKKYKNCGFFTQLCEKSPDLNLDKIN